MGHNAFEGSYRKPNIKLHIIIFFTIVGVSVFLSTQVEKTKNNVGVEALKKPVPIDSVFVEESSENPNTQIATTPATSPSVSKEQETDYHFDSGPNLTAIEQMLAKSEETELPAASAENNSIVVESTAASEDIKSEKEKDVAIMVTDEESNNANAIISVSDNAAELKVALTPDVDATIPKTNNKKIGKMDTVYELQQDRFLETLAKTANAQAEETEEVRRMKQAMRSDQPLTMKSAVNAGNENGDENGAVVKVVSTEKSGIPVGDAKNTKSNKKASTVKKTVIAKNSPPITVNKKPMSSGGSISNEILITRGELDNVLSQFARSYNQGDIQRLMALFDENAITNDQTDKNGIKAEYAELFSNTSVRSIKIKNIQWDLGKGKARGDARFTVIVKPMGSTENARIDGKLEIVAVKESRGVFIKSLLHEINAR